MTRDEFDFLNEERLDNFIDPPITFKCKPCFNFQSIEFEVTTNRDGINEVIDLYKQVLSELMEIAPEQPTNKSSKPVEELASDKQIAIMQKFGIPFVKGKTTRKEAQQLIQKNIEG